MFPNDTAAITDGSVTHVYGLTSLGDRKSIRSESAAPSDLPAEVTISHQDVGTGLGLRRRSNLSFSRMAEDADGNQGVVRAYLVVEQPLKIASTATVKKTTTELIAFLAVATYHDKFLTAEI